MQPSSVSSSSSESLVSLLVCALSGPWSGLQVQPLQGPGHKDGGRNGDKKGKRGLNFSHFQALGLGEADQQVTNRSRGSGARDDWGSLGNMKEGHERVHQSKPYIQVQKPS